jgi:hypothetical protein
MGPSGALAFTAPVPVAEALGRPLLLALADGVAEREGPVPVPVAEAEAVEETGAEKVSFPEPLLGAAGVPPKGG